jgi:hypothetical protein
MSLGLDSVVSTRKLHPATMANFVNRSVTRMIDHRSETAAAVRLWLALAVS